MPLDGKRILLVEDEVLLAMDLKAALEACGAVVLGPCAKLKGAMHTADAEGPVDGAVLDVNLGEDLVFALADRLTADGVPFVFHTGLADIDSLHHRYGDVPVLLKPTRSEDVVHHLGGTIVARGQS